MKIQYSLVSCLFTFVLLCSSCSPEKVSHPILLRAESLMECCVDSALLLLQGIEHPEKLHKAERARYAVLRTQVDDKNFIDHTSDSLIKTAVEYYQKHGSTPQLMEALYYQASVYRDMGAAPRALDYFQQAIDVSKTQTEHKLLSRIYGQMGTLYFLQELPKEGMNAYKKSRDHALLTNDSLRIIHSSIYMARVYTEQNNVDSTLHYYKEAEHIAHNIGNVELENDVQSELAGIYLQLGELEDARKLLSGKKRSGTKLLKLGDLHKKSGLIDSAKYYFQKAREDKNIYNKARGNYELYCIEKQQDNNKQAFYYLEQYLFFQDSLQRATDTEGVKRIESLYTYQHIENENNRLLLKNKHKESIIYLGLLLSGIAFCLFYWRWKKMKDQKELANRLIQIRKQEYQKKIADYDKAIETLKKEINQISVQSNQEKEQLQQELDRTIGEQRRMIEQRQEAEAAFRSSSIYQQIHRVSKDVKFEMSDENWNELKKEIDKAFNDFTSRLYMLRPELKQRELYVCLLVKAGVPNSDIATLVNLEENSVSSIRTRLYEKVHGKKGKAKDFNDFIKDL